MKTKEEILTVKDIVLELLEKDERCRNDDKWLVYMVTRRFTNIYIPFEDFSKFPTFETVTRCRRIIQNKEKLFKPTNIDIINKRMKREEVFRDINKIV